MPYDVTLIENDVDLRSDAPSSLDLAQREAVAEMRTARLGGLVDRDRLSVLVLGGGFLVTAAALVAVVPTERSPSLFAVAAFVVAYGFVSRVEFELGSGSLVPTELLLVPMLFVLPLGWVPLAVVAAYVGGSLVDAARGRIHLERVLLRLIDSWHAVGPVLVLAVAGERPPRWDDWPLYVAALVAQYAFEFVSCAVRERLVSGLNPIVLLRLMARGQLADAALAPVGLAFAFAAAGDPLGGLLALPLVVLLSVFARERRTRIDHEVGGLLGEVGAIVRSCHERWDGRGYPDGLAGEDIPLVARIVGCCDAFSAMTTDRPYRAALSLDTAVAELRANAGTQFDPQVVSALENVLARGN